MAITDDGAVTITKATNPVLEYENEFRQLKAMRDDWDPLYRDVQENMYARKGRYLFNEDEKPDDGEKRDNKIINPTPTLALDDLAAGMQGGLTSQANPWLEFGLTNKRLENDAVREWLQETRDIVLDIFSRSNFYGSTHSLYGEVAAFGTAVMLIEKDLETVIRCKTFTVGEYWLALDGRFKPTTLYRRYAMSARNLVNTFGEENVPGEVRVAAKDSTTSETTFKVMHCIRPNKNRDVTKLDSSNMAFESRQWVESIHDGKFLKKSGYKGLPFMAPRWFTRGTDAVYGRGPGITARGDCQQLQGMESDKNEASAKNVKPPMMGDSSLKQQGGGTIVPSGMNYGDTQQSQPFIQPVYRVAIDFQNVAYELDRIEQRIRRTLMNHLFTSALDATKEMTAREVAERAAERAMMLGPVMDKLLGDEGLRVAIDQTLQYAEELNLLPEPPEEIQGEEIEIEYISVLAREQKSQGLSTINTTLQFVGGLAEFYGQEALDSINVDKTIDEWADMSQVPATIINDQAERDAKRQDRAQVEQAQMAAQMAEQSANTAKTLSETNTSPDSENALTSISQAVQDTIPAGAGAA